MTVSRPGLAGGFVGIASFILACAPSPRLNDVTPRDRLCAIVGHAQEHYRGRFFPLQGVTVSVDKDIGLPEATALSDSHGRVVLWDAKCGSRPYTVTATDRDGRRLTSRTVQPSDFDSPGDQVPARYRRFSFSAFTFGISSTTVASLSVVIGAYQRRETEELVSLDDGPALAGREISILVRHELLPTNSALTINGESLRARLLESSDPRSVRDRTHQYRYVPPVRGSYEGALASWYDDVAVSRSFTIQVE